MRLFIVEQKLTFPLKTIKVVLSLIMCEPVRFFGGSKIFSNFHLMPITINGLSYPTCEHYFQAMKFANTNKKYAEEIRKSETPLKAKKMGGSRAFPIEKAWNEKRDDVMRTALFVKALQNPEFKEELLATGEAEIIEAAPRDYYWGEGTKKTGKNMLGKLLMELRDRIKACEDTIYLAEDDN